MKNFLRHSKRGLIGLIAGNLVLANAYTADLMDKKFESDSKHERKNIKQWIYEVKLTIRKDASVELNKLKLDKNYVTDFVFDKKLEGIMNAQIISEDGNILSDTRFRPSFVVFTDPPTVLDKAHFPLYLPYSEEGKYLKIYYKGEEKFLIELKDNLCDNDGVCDEYENYYSCPNDCGKDAKDGTCVSKSGDGICDPDCLFDKDCEQK